MSSFKKLVEQFLYESDKKNDPFRLYHGDNVQKFERIWRQLASVILEQVQDVKSDRYDSNRRKGSWVLEEIIELLKKNGPAAGTQPLKTNPHVPLTDVDGNPIPEETNLKKLAEKLTVWAAKMITQENVPWDDAIEFLEDKI